MWQVSTGIMAGARPKRANRPRTSGGEMREMAMTVM